MNDRTTRQALKTREEMRAAGIPADAYTYDALSMACGLAGEWEAAEAVVREMVASCGNERVVPTEAAGATASSPGSGSPAAAAGGRESEGERLGEGEGERKESPSSSSAAAEESSPPSTQSQKDRLRQRRRREKLKNGVPPNPTVFHGLMEAYARSGEWERALECLDDMIRASRGGWLEEEEVPSGAEEEERVGLRAAVEPDSTTVGWAIQVRYHTCWHSHRFCYVSYDTYM